MDLARKKLSPQATSGLRGSWLAIYHIVLSMCYNTNTLLHTCMYHRENSRITSVTYTSINSFCPDTGRTQSGRQIGG